MAQILTADGCQEASNIRFEDACCPPPLCELDYCAMACAFINLLPSGPLWDRPKAEALSRYPSAGPAACAPAPAPEMGCQSLVAYAIYMSQILVDLLRNALAPTLREADPYTAVTTLDDWLDRLGWQDCYATQCRSVLLGDLTPYEIMGECGPIFCPVASPPELELAVKRGIVIALSRANMGGIKTLYWLNWVIEPLGAKIEGRNILTADCDTVQFTISRISDTLPAVIDGYCLPEAAAETVPADITRGDCDRPAGAPEVIWPGIVAAECIVRSMLPNNCPNNIFRSC